MQSAIKSTIFILGLSLSIHAQAAPFSSINCTHTENPQSKGKLQLKYNEDQLKKLTHNATVYSYGQNGREETSIEQTPHVAVRVGDASFTGSNRGEWGGELVLVEASGDTKILFKDNIHDIYNTKNGVIVISGLSHLMTNKGRIYLITKNESTIDYQILFGLDSAPEDSWITDSGEIFITTSYGTSILKQNGTLQRVLCEGHEYYKYNGNP